MTVVATLAKQLALIKDAGVPIIWHRRNVARTWTFPKFLAAV